MVSVIIPSYNPGGLLADCLRSIPRDRTEVIVVDNGSSDEKVQEAARDFPEVRFIFMGRNTGFAYACNRGTEQASGQFLLFLNQDTELLKGGLKAAIDYLSDDKRRGIVSGRITYPDGKLQLTLRRFPRLVDLFFGRRSPLSRIFPDNPWTSRYLYKDLDLNRAQQLEACTGMFMLVRKELFRALGGFDEGFFFYVEDIDLCKRACDMGSEVWYIPRTVAVHHVGENIPGKARTYVKMHHYRGFYRYLVKHRRPGYLGRFFLWLGAGIAIVLHLGFSRIGK